MNRGEIIDCETINDKPSSSDGLDEDTLATLLLVATYLGCWKSACLTAGAAVGIDPNVLGQDNVGRKGQVHVSLNDGRVELRLARHLVHDPTQVQGRRRLDGPPKGRSERSGRGNSAQEKRRRELHFERIQWHAKEIMRVQKSRTVCNDKICGQGPTLSSDDWIPDHCTRTFVTGKAFSVPGLLFP